MNLKNDVGTSTPISSRAWSVAKVFDVAALRSEAPKGQLIEVFTVLDDLANRADREAAGFIAALSDHVPDFEPRIRALVAAAQLEASTLGSWMLLLRGSAQTLALGDRAAAANARQLVQLLIAAHVPAGVLAGLVDDFDLDYESLQGARGPLLMAGADSTSYELTEPPEPRGEPVVPLDIADEVLARAEVAAWLASQD